MASQGPNNPSNAAQGQIGTQVKNMAQGAANIGKGAVQGAVSIARGAALGTANMKQGAADAVKNTLETDNDTNIASGCPGTTTDASLGAWKLPK